MLPVFLSIVVKLTNIEEGVLGAQEGDTMGSKLLHKRFCLNLLLL